MQNNVSLLAVRAKDDNGIMLELWESVEKFISRQAYRYARNGLHNGTRLFDVDDLTQSGYFALIKAVDGYDPDSGMSFLSYLNFHLRRSFAEVSGHLGTKQRPEVDATSLDKDIAYEDSTDTLVDLVPDSRTQYIYDDLIDAVGVEQAYSELMDEVEKLPYKQRICVETCVCQGEQRNVAADMLGVSVSKVSQLKRRALQALTRSEAAQRLKAEFEYNPRHITLTQYKINLTSAVEAHILWRERRELL